MTFEGMARIQAASTKRALAQRAAIRSSRSSSSRSTSSTRADYTDLSAYGSSRLPGTAVQERADGSKVYYKDGKVVREVSKTGVQIVRVGVSKTAPSTSGKISRLTAPVMLQQRYMEQLDSYNKTLARLERDRQAELRTAAFQKGIRETTYAGLGASHIFDKAVLSRLTGPYSAAYKKRQAELLDKQLAYKIQEAKKLKFKLGQVNAFSKMSDKEFKQLQKITKKVSRVELQRKKLAVRHEAVVKKITGVAGRLIKGDSYVARAARNLPAQAFAMFYNLAPSLYKASLEVDAFFTMATASPAVIDRQGFRRAAVANFKKTGNAIVEAYDPRKPENLFNIILTATSIASLGYAKANAAAFAKQVKAGSITKGRVTVYGPKTANPTYIVKGTLKLPAIKYLGKTIPARTVAFRTLQRVSRATFKSKAFKTMGSTKYVLKQAKIGLRNVRFKKVFVNREKTVLFKGKGVTKPLAKGRHVLSKSKISLKAGLKRKTIRSRAVVAKKKITSLSSKETRTLVTRLKKLQNTDKVVRLKFEAKYARVSSPTILKVVRSTISKIAKNLAKSRLSKRSLLVAKTNLKTLKTFMSKYVKSRGSLLKDKRATLSPGRPETFTGLRKSVPRDFTKIDSMLKRVESLQKSRFKPVARKVSSIRARPTQRVSYSAKYFDPNLVFQGFRLIAKPLIFNKFIPVVPVLSPVGSPTAYLSFPVAPAIPRVVSGPVAPAKPVARVDAGADPVPEPVPTSPTAITQSLISSPLVLSRFLPFMGGLPIPSISGAGRVFSLPLSRFTRAENLRYNADLYSKIYGLRATKSDRSNLLRAGRSFSGLEVRRIV